MELPLFVLVFALLLIHEMDAVRAKEWKMFIILKDLPDKKAYVIFTVIHIPLYFAAIFMITQAGTPTVLILQYAIDIFLVCHAVIHYCFKRHPENRFTSAFSKAMIYSAGVLAIVHMGLLAFC